MPHSPHYAIEIDHLHKIYHTQNTEKIALDDLSLKIETGSFFALLGPNGAGKSTLINIIAGLTNKTSGNVKIWGYDLITQSLQARRSIGIVPQEIYLDAFFTPRQNIELQAGLYGIKKEDRRTNEILEHIDLKDKADSYSRSLSGGMRRRLLLGKALAHHPKVLILDEPTAGVDLKLRQQLWDYVKKLNKNGITVVLTTHYLEEAEKLCDTIAIINKGQLLTCQSKNELLKEICHKTLILTMSEALKKIPDTLNSFQPKKINDHCISFTYNINETPTSALIEAIQGAHITIRDISTQDPNLEDIFLKMTS